MIGDLSYGVDIMDDGRVPGVGTRRLLRARTDKVMALRSQIPDLVGLPTHDPTTARRLLKAEARRRGR